MDSLILIIALLQVSQRDFVGEIAVDHIVHSFILRLNVNLDALDVDEAQRSLDFLSGASYALNGTVFKVASSIFVLAPYNVDVSGNISNEMYGEAADDYYTE